MNTDPDPHHRRSIRLQDYDYSQPGAYFISIVVHGRECLLADIINDEAILTPSGQLVQQAWQDLPIRFSACTLDAFVVMPNHVHGIIIITHDHTPGVTNPHPDPHAALGSIVRAFKSTSAIHVN